MATELYANVATTTVSSGGTTAPAGGTSEAWTVASSTPFPAAATGVSQFHVADPAAPSELVTVTNVSGTAWTVTRGAESTTPVTHSAGFTIWLVVTAADMTALLVNANNLSDVSSVATARANLGLGAAAVIGTPVSIANGGTGAASQQAAMDALAGAVTSGDFLRGNGTHVVVAAIQASDVPTLNQNTTGTASNITGPLSGVPAPTASVSLNSEKITSLANGSASSDAAAYGQTPAGGTTVTIAQGGTGQTGAPAAYNALSPMTTKGDIEYDSAAATAARLAIGTTGQPLVVDSTGVPKWGTQTPTWTNPAGLTLTSAGSQASLTSPVSLSSAAETPMGSMTVPANDPVAGSIYRLTCFGFDTTDSTSGTFTLNLTWGATSLCQIAFTPTASLTNALWRVDAVVTFVTASTCNAMMTCFHNTAVSPGFGSNTNMAGTAAAATVTVSSSEALAIQGTNASPAHVTWTCLGSVPERVW